MFKSKEKSMLSKNTPFPNALAISNLNLLQVFDQSKISQRTSEKKELLNSIDFGAVKIVEVILKENFRKPGTVQIFLYFKLWYILLSTACIAKTSGAGPVCSDSDSKETPISLKICKLHRKATSYVSELNLAQCCQCFSLLGHQKIFKS